eukprot:Gregarina_sp_Poly_1__7860@NODE_4466_length_588_cov_26_800384_g2991_i0_p1_GENE_NODE_4466_length_588_cov_26_800384_g2991_i0NODE_4466_length_588_cov_26_800384_g2991_i0_p1_ORF_typecomplete_len115_score2_24GST_N_4/PF17172_4/0_21_NODE_4466_length_588_cov_26_800384_g2991_i0119463
MSSSHIKTRHPASPALAKKRDMCIHKLTGGLPCPPNPRAGSDFGTSWYQLAPPCTHTGCQQCGEYVTIKSSRDYLPNTAAGYRSQLPQLMQFASRQSNSHSPPTGLLPFILPRI